MKVAFIFPGQASQYVGMGKDLYENSQIAREIFDEAEEILGFELKRIHRTTLKIKLGSKDEIWNFS